jgi:predicted component of type VI protein secretion system
MPGRSSYGEIHIDVTAGSERVQAQPELETPFRISLLGDFSGRGNRQLIEIGEAMANRRPTLIDRHVPVVGGEDGRNSWY